MGLPLPGRLPIRLRLALWYTFFLVLTVGAISLFLLASLENNLLREVDDALGLRATQVQRTVSSEPDMGLGPGKVAPGLLDLAPLEELSAPGIYVQLFDERGALLASSANLPGGRLPLSNAVIERALAGREVHETVPVGPERVRVLARPLETSGKPAGVVVVGESLHPLDLTLQRARQLLVLASGFSAVAALLSGWWVTNRGLKPLSEVTRLARQIASTGRFEQRIVEPQAHDEVAELAATFNTMLDRLEKIFERQKDFLADASHELRGPLMVIRGNLDLLKLDLAKTERETSAREAAEEVDRMSRLVADLLFLAEADAQEVVEHHPVALDDVLSGVCTRARALAGAAHHVVLAHNEPAVVLGDRDRLSQMLWNLVENALRHTPAGGRITLSLRRYEQIAELAVSDTGMGISPEHLPRIFERFYRADRARSRSQGGTGLGLAIVKQVAEAHGGQVRVRSEPGQGSTFTVVLPTLQR